MSVLTLEGLGAVTYDRTSLKTRIVHLGFGAFHRAHMADYTDAVARQSDSDWGICAVSLFSDNVIGAMRQQGHLYTLAELGAQSTDVRIIGAVTGSVHPALDGPMAVVEKLAEPQVAIVSMTITEKGYCLDPSTGLLDPENPLILADLASPERPQSALGYLVRALSLRRARGVPPFSVLSCDNIRNNGAVARAALCDLACQLDPGLAAWIAQNVSFPATMVDRIVPAATRQSLSDIAAITGVADPCAIASEPFSQWVIEDDFVAGRPDWEMAGAQFVGDVGPYEDMKLRMLNGSHSFLAYLGYLAGYEHIADTMADPAFRQAALKLMLNDQAPSLSMPDDTDLMVYAQALIDRFSNPALRHRTWQVAMDGSQKIPQRFGPSLGFHVRRNSGFGGIALGVAGWMRYVAGTDDGGNPIDVRDPMAADLRAICDARGGDVSIVRELLAMPTLFDAEIGQDDRVIAAVSAAYQSLLDHGAQAGVAAFSQG